MPVKFLNQCCGAAVLALLCLAAQSARALWDEPANMLFASQVGGTVISVINVTGDRVVGRVVTDYPVDDIAASGYGDYAFAAHADASKVTVIDLRKGKIERVVPVSIRPRHLTFEQNSGLVMTDSVEGGMALLDATGKRELFVNRDIPPSKDVIFGPTGIVAYYHSGKAGRVGAVALDSGRALWQVPVPVSRQSVPLVRSLDGLFIVYVLPEAGEAHALLAASGRAIASRHLGRGLSRPYVTANGQYFLIAEQANRQVHVLSQGNFNPLMSISTTQPTTLVTSGLFDVMAVAFGDSKLYAMDLLKFARQPVNELPLKGPASDVIVTSDSKHAYAAIPSAGAVAHLNLRSGELSYIEGIERPEILTMGVSNAVCH